MKIKEWNQNKIEEVSSGKCDYEKDYMKIKFNSDDDLPISQYDHNYQIYF